MWTINPYVAGSCPASPGSQFYRLSSVLSYSINIDSNGKFDSNWQVPRFNTTISSSLTHSLPSSRPMHDSMAITMFSSNTPSRWSSASHSSIKRDVGPLIAHPHTMSDRVVTALAKFFWNSPGSLREFEKSHPGPESNRY